MAVDVSESVTVGASPEAVYRVVSDMRRMAGLAAECFAVRPLRQREGRPPRFVGFNRRGPRVWFTVCTVTLDRPGEDFGYAVRSLGMPVAFWGYKLAAVPDGTRITEYFEDRRGAVPRLVGRLTGMSDRPGINKENIRATLDRLKREVEAAAP